MRTLLRSVVVMLLFFSSVEVSLAQNEGRVCFIDSVNGPTMLCSVLDLHMGTAFKRLPTDGAGGTQPEKLCNQEGTAENIVWYAFQAQSKSLHLRIQSKYCQFSDGHRLQFGIYADTEFKNAVFCQAKPWKETHKDIVLDDLIVGHTYYFFLDGYDFARCAYNIQVMNQSSVGTFDINNQTPVLKCDALSGGKMCSGVLTKMYLESDIHAEEYHWTILNKTTNTSEDFVTSAYEMPFENYNAGEYSVTVYGKNNCGRSRVSSLVFLIEDLNDEVFKDITVCGMCESQKLKKLDDGCIISGEKLSLQDPNNDGTSGWMGETTVQRGKESYAHTVTMPNGCTYTQKVNISVTQNSGLVQRDTFYCSGGITVDEVTRFNGETYRKNVNGAAEDGCPAQVEYTVRLFDPTGSVVTDCSGGSNSVDFSTTYIDKSLINLSILDKSGNTVSVGDLTSGVTYVLEVSLKSDASCSGKKFDFQIGAPNAPVIKNVNACSNETTVELKVEDVNEFSTYDWKFEDNVVVVGDDGNDGTISINTPTDDLNYSVAAVNGCGTSQYAKGKIKVVESLVLEVKVPKEIVRGEEFTVENISDGQYDWQIPSEVKINGNNKKQGVFTCVYNGSEDQLQLSLSSKDSKCGTSKRSFTVKVIDCITDVNINCSNDIENQLTFSWEVESWMSDVRVSCSDLDNSNIIVDLAKGTATLTNLTEHKLMEVSFSFETNSSCPPVQKEASCTPEICDKAATIELSASDTEFCLKDHTKTVSLRVKNHSGGLWKLSDGTVLPSATFDPHRYGVGVHNVFYHFEIEGCSREISKSIVINAKPSPSLKKEIEYIRCPKDEYAANVTLAKEGQGQVTMFINGKESNDASFQWKSGEYNVILEDDSGCDAGEIINIPVINDNRVAIVGEDIVKKGQEEWYTIDYRGSKTLEDISWTVDGDEMENDDKELLYLAERDSGSVVMVFSAVTSEGCDIEATKTIYIDTPTLFNDPTAFSPNGDDVNEYFEMSSRSGDIKVVSFRIFNRYGNVVKEDGDFVLNSTSRILWDGNYNTRPAESGIYIFVLEYIDDLGRKKVLSQDITLFR